MWLALSFVTWVCRCSGGCCQRLPSTHLWLHACLHQQRLREAPGLDVGAGQTSSWKLTTLCYRTNGLGTSCRTPPRDEAARSWRTQAPWLQSEHEAQLRQVVCGHLPPPFSCAETLREAALCLLCPEKGLGFQDG